MINSDFESTFFNPYSRRGGVRKIKSRVDLEAVMMECHEAIQASDDELRKLFKTFSFSFDLSRQPSDPFSEKYKDFVLSCYEEISGKEYRPENERSDFLDVEKFVARPFPFYTGSYRTVSDQLIMVGLIIRAMRLPEGARIMEFGSGWGNTAVNLSRMGYKVTVVDVDERFLEIVKRRSDSFSGGIETVRGDFSVVSQMVGEYDAILFKECFHHCLDHADFLDEAREKLKAEGVICFAGEPVYPEFPVPWGVQSDGESVWAIRNFGWLELGFSESYFVGLLEDRGFSVEKMSCSLIERGGVFIAKKN